VDNLGAQAKHEPNNAAEDLQQLSKQLRREGAAVGMRAIHKQHIDPVSQRKQMSKRESNRRGPYESRHSFQNPKAPC
jgi:hypothetical protein